MPKNIILYVFLICLHTTAYSLEIELPPRAVSLDLADIDLDGDMDIVVGCDPFDVTSWSGISILKNLGSGDIVLEDTTYVYSFQRSVNIGKMNANEYDDILVHSYDIEQNYSIYLIYYDYCIEGFTDSVIVSCEQSVNRSKTILGNFDGDPYKDFVFTSNSDFLLGIINNESGQFSDPIYFDLAFPPTDVAAGDLFGDSRDEIVVCGSQPYIFFQTDQGWDSMGFDEGINFGEAAVVDIDNDGDNDIITNSISPFGDHCRVTMYDNTDIGFELVYDELFYTYLFSLNMFDYNNDELPDLFQAGRILTNLGDFTFDEHFQAYDSQFIRKHQFADMDNNGWLDIVSCGHNTNTNRGFCIIYFNDGNGNFLDEPLSIDNEELIINNYKLSNFPNPFNPNTTISFNFSNELYEINQPTAIEIYNIKGQLIQELGVRNLELGMNSIVWDGTDNHRNQVSSGVYLYRLTADNKVLMSNKMIMIK
jgi:hypothetical protein